MDIRIYFQKVREVEASISTDFTVIVSLETPDGGKPGARTEVARYSAAKLIVEGRARLATTDEAAEYKENAERARADAEQAAAASRVQFTIVSDQDAKALRGIRHKG